MTSRTASESSFSPIAVDPLRSEKTIVTVFRTSCAGSSGASGVPQKPQRRNFAGFSSPQLGQICTKGSLGTPADQIECAPLGAAAPRPRSGSTQLLLFAAFRRRAVLDLFDHGRVGEGSRVAELAIFGDVAKQPAHDLPRTRLRQLRGEDDVGRPGDLADFLRHVLAE